MRETRERRLWAVIFALLLIIAGMITAFCIYEAQVQLVQTECTYTSVEGEHIEVYGADGSISVTLKDKNKEEE